VGVWIGFEGLHTINLRKHVICGIVANGKTAEGNT
jgi:hypothetical protein